MDNLKYCILPYKKFCPACGKEYPLEFYKCDKGNCKAELFILGRVFLKDELILIPVQQNETPVKELVMV